MPEIGNSEFYCSRAFRNMAPRPWAMMKVGKSLSQQFRRRVSISVKTFMVGSLTLEPPEYPNPRKSTMLMT